MSHSHDHQPASYNRAFALGVGLNLLFAGIEAGYGFYAGSLALIADAGHNLSDVFGLLLAWGASLLAAKSATDRRTYGYRKATVMASLASAILLLIALGAIAWEALGRLFEPQSVAGSVVITVAAVGFVINTVTASLFASGQKRDLNLRGAFLHMAADAGVSLGVVFAGILIAIFGWLWVDPAISLLIVAVILVGTWGLLRDSINYAIDAVPAGIDLPGIRDYLNGLEQVTAFHDLHVWPLSTTEAALTVHLVVSDGAVDNGFLRRLQDQLHERFGIGHATIQVERADADTLCLLDPGRGG